MICLKGRYSLIKIIILIVIMSCLGLELRYSYLKGTVRKRIRNGEAAIEIQPDVRDCEGLSCSRNTAAVVTSPNDTVSTSSRKTLPILTIFTSFKNNPNRFRTQHNVLMNWALLIPRVIPVLFDSNTDPKLFRIAKDLGWKILPVPANNSHGTPYFKEMYFASKKHFDSIFYGWANGDLLFTDNLADTMDVIGKNLNKLNQTLVVGRRTNVNIENATIYNHAHVTELAVKKGHLFQIYAEDYFFIARNNFPWEGVPNLTIGRRAYDNFIVAYAIDCGVSVVDATQTLLAFHQDGEPRQNKDEKHNLNIIGPFHYGKGATTKAWFETTRNQNSRKIKIWRRRRPL